MKETLKKPIKSVDISYNNESNKISYNEYYFSGIPIPKDIKYEIKDNKLNLSWNIDKYKFKNLINTFHVQIKVNNKENTYTTLFNEYSLDNYETNVEYEVKIRSCIDNLFGDWSEIIKFKIDDFKGNNSENNIFGQIYNEKDNNQKSVSLFSNLNQTKNIFGSQDKKDNNTPSLFSFNNNQNKNESIFKSSDNSPLFSNNNEKAQGNSLFGSKPLFGNSLQNSSTNSFSSGTNIFGNNDVTKKSPQISLFNNNFIKKEDKDEKKVSGLFGNNNQNLFHLGYKNDNIADNNEKDEEDL